MERLQQSGGLNLCAWYYRDCNFHRGRGLITRIVGQSLTARIPGGVSIRLRNPMEHIQNAIMCNGGIWEPEETAIVTRLLSPGMTFVDIGANIGYYTLVASALVGETGQVHSFEPVPRVFAALSENVALNRLSNVRLNNLALSEVEEEREMFVSTGYNQGLHSFGALQEHTVPTRIHCSTLDAYCDREIKAPIDLLKMDVEGAELLVLRGAGRLIATRPPRAILMELNDELAQGLGYATREVKHLLVQGGYHLQRIDGEDLGTPIDLDARERYTNILALHETVREEYQARLR